MGVKFLRVGFQNSNIIKQEPFIGSDSVPEAENNMEIRNVLISIRIKVSYFLFLIISRYEAAEFYACLSPIYPWAFRNSISFARPC